jgi:hypothetical protein
MENLGTYFFVALVIGFAIYLTQKKKKVAHPTADEERVFNPKAPSKPKLKKEPTKKGTPTEGTTTGSHQPPRSSKSAQTASPSKSDELDLVAEPTTGPTQNDLENEVKLLQTRTGWDYATAKAYCESSLDYHKKVSAGATLKK